MPLRWILGYGLECPLGSWEREPMGPENPESAGNGLLGEDSPVGTVLRWDRWL
jgi:hypothetical protein